MSAVCIIPARGGSVRIPRKNIRLFHGKPIIAYSIECAKASGLFGDDIYVSTDDSEIAEISHAYGAKIITRGRDDGTRGTQEVMQEALCKLNVASMYACCLYATTPMLKPQTLLHAKAYLTGHAYVVPCATWLRDPGQFYFGYTNAFINGVPLLSRTCLLPIDPATECDINTEDDWQRAEQMYLKGKS